ncbi:hypothetical protein AGMMS49949_09570 [Alphaproteobacteria bacterium]|nr:hypothetical protein AGMMS49949_09570 [Alphaproteobacteria bacterium]GHT00492.1 hypothetical protein AGMMS50296_8810 [Alphaproteobacteria bacterium]
MKETPQNPCPCKPVTPSAITLEGILHNIHAYPVTVSGGFLIISVTMIKLIKKLRGK